MKLQYLTVVFILIILPISLVLSFYIQGQITTVTLQTKYDEKLITSTYDAVKAFQLNTVNNTESDISNSKIRDVQARC